MTLFKTTFGNNYKVDDRVIIDGDGIHDGGLVHRWKDMKKCSLEHIRLEERMRFLGEDYNHLNPFTIYITPKKGFHKAIILYGLGFDEAPKTAKAINHFSQRNFINMKQFHGKPIPTYVIVLLILFLAIQIVFVIINILRT